MQLLFQVDLRGGSRRIGERRGGDQDGADYFEQIGRTIAEACADASPDEAEVARFAQGLIEGTLEHQAQIDQRLQAVTRNWDLRRMAAIDRNVLRMAIYELMHVADVPPKVAINEAIELAKKFSTKNSGGFVNGILDRVRIDLERERAQQRDGTETAPASDGNAPSVDSDGASA